MRTLWIACKANQALPKSVFAHVPACVLKFPGQVWQKVKGLFFKVDYHQLSDDNQEECLKTHHKLQYAECMKTKNNKAMVANEPRELILPARKHTTITHHLAKGMCPLNTLGNRSFRKMADTLDKWYVIYSCIYFSIGAILVLHKKVLEGKSGAISVMERIKHLICLQISFNRNVAQCKGGSSVCWFNIALAFWYNSSQG